MRSSRVFIASALVRHPVHRTLALLRKYYEQQRTELGADAAKRDALLKVGVTKADAALDPTALAALANVAGVVMNSPDAFTVR